MFEILVNYKYKEVIDSINIFFKKGSIYKITKNNSVVYRVNSLNDLSEVIIPHFKKYLLLSTKKITFILWIKVIELINKGEHKNKKGLNEILSLYASIGRDLSKKVMHDFPLLNRVSKPIYVKPNVELSEFWISGYFSIYCNFKVDLNSHGWKNSYYNRVVPSFNFSRSIK